MSSTTAQKSVTIDGNEAAAHVAHRTNEVIAIYPITPASPMGELADLWASHGVPNIWNSVPRIVEMQSEGGAAGAVHGALQAGSLTTTFTASQGLLLMIPNMYKIAGELTSTVFHIAARSIAGQALSIFGDHSDVMAARATGWGMLFANSIQEIADFALISQTASLESRVPFLHIFDGFRSSHEIQKIELPSDEVIREMISDELVRAHRDRALTPDAPVLRGTAQNPDVFFQAREAANPFYLATPTIVQNAMDSFAALTGRQYHLFDHVGAPDAERVIVLMGSGAETVEETVRHLNKSGEKVGVMKVRLFRPFAVDAFINALPESVKSVAVLDRTKEPGSAGEPLYQDVVTALVERGTNMPRVVGGRYGLSSKEFTPGMVKRVFDELLTDAPKNHFTIGITDDVTMSSLPWEEVDIESPDVTRAVFWGLGSDGTVGANKNSIKIIGEETDGFAQGYFVYDSKKSGARTISHLRFGPEPIRSPYLIQKADFVGVHQFGFLERYNTLDLAAEGATLLLNSPVPVDKVWAALPISVQEQIIEKRLRVYVIDAYAVARENRLGGRINTIMQTCFFALSGVLPRDEAIDKIKTAIRKTYGKRGEVIVNMNNAAVDAALSHMHELDVPSTVVGDRKMRPPVSHRAPQFVQDVTATMIAGDGDQLPVSMLPVDGTYPTATAKWEKRGLSADVPVWEPDICIQCGKCVVVCPHAVIRAKVAGTAAFADAPGGFKTADPAWRDFEGSQYTLQVSPEDCTGCKLCVEVCPAKDKSNVSRKALNMAPLEPILTSAQADWDFFLGLPELKRAAGANGRGDTVSGAGLAYTRPKDIQLLDPLFEFSGACSGCGETPYLSLMSRLFGDRTIVANATGCSSIYGGNLPTTPWATNADGRGPAWSNSLFEDNAEFGLGMRIAIEKQAEQARELLNARREVVGDDLVDALLGADQSSEQGIADQRQRVAELKSRLENQDDPQSADLLSLADKLVEKIVWIVGGDGWAYDIGYGGLDHVLASGKNVNVLVLDTEVYSNTGGQSSKATGLGAVAKFAAGGKQTPKKDLGLIAMGYGYVYVAQIAMGANDTQTIKALEEAVSYDGPSLIIAYSHCIAHGIDMAKGLEQQDLAAKSGYWPLYRFDPRRIDEGKNPLQLDSRKPSVPFREYAYNENRYRMLRQTRPEAAAQFAEESQRLIDERWKRYNAMAAAQPNGQEAQGPAKPTPGSAPPKMPPKPLPPSSKLPPSKLPPTPAKNA